MKTKRLLSMLICICMVCSIVFQTGTTYAMTESEAYISDEIFVDSGSGANEETENEIPESFSAEPIETYSSSSTSEALTYGGSDYVINTDEMESYYYGDFEYVINSDGATATIIYWYGNNRDDIVFPKEVDGYPVTIIGDGKDRVCSSWFSGSVVFPNGVTVINNNAFCDCQSLKGTLVIPDTVTYIGWQAFFNCRKLTGSLVIPKSVAYIGRSSFMLCEGLTGPLVIPDGMTSIERSAFASCIGFTSFKLPDSITSIGENSFSGCTGLKGSIEIPDKVTSIGPYAFENCSGLTGNLVIPDGVTSIGDFAFFACNGLTSLKLSESLTSIGKYAFTSCTGFKCPLVIPDSVTSIGEFAFSECSGFTALTLSNNLTAINLSTFESCRGFTGSLVIPDGVTYIGESAFSGCSNFDGTLTIPDSVTVIDAAAFYGCSDFTGSLVIPDGITEIPYEAFMGCSGFTGSLVIPDSVTYIEGYAFSGCSGFRGTLVIPDSVTYIGTSAFAKCGFPSIAVSDSLTNVGSLCFDKCLGLLSFVLSISDLSNISGSLKSRLSEASGNVKTIFFSEGLITLPSEMFNTYNNLQSVYINGDVPTSWGENAINENVVIYYPEGNTSGWTSPTWTAPDGTVYNTKTYKIGSTWDTTDYTISGDWTYSFKGTVYSTAKNGFESIEIKITSASDESVGVTYYSATDVGIPFYDLTAIPSLKRYAILRDENQAIILAPGTSWKIQLSATDADGNTLGDSEIITLTIAGTALEQGPPTISGLSDNYSIKRGEAFTLEGKITAFGAGFLDKVILKHHKTNTVFEDRILDVGLSSATVNLSEFTIPADTYPLNTLGTHLFKIYATANNFTDSSKVIGAFYITVEHDCDWVYSEAVSDSATWSKVDADYHKQISEKAEYKCSLCGKTKVETVSVDSALEPHKLSIEKITGTAYEVLEATHEDYMIKHKVIQSKALECEAKGCGHEISDESDFVYEFHDIEYGACKYCGFILSSDEKVRVTFNLNGGTGTFATIQEVIVGNVVKEPEEPTKSGYVFMGWYSNPECGGYSWFSSIMNNGKGMPVSSDVTLYAKWEESKNIVYGRDTFSFVNTYSSFLDDYVITGDYYDILMRDLNGLGEKAYVKSYMESDWGGSCFGMSAVLTLIRAGRLDVDFFQTNAKTTYDFDAPVENDTINNLINYYHVMQCTYHTASIRSDHNRIDETDNNKEIITAVIESSYPVVVTFNQLDKNGSHLYGHAVVAYGYEETESGYNIAIWDPNYKNTPNTLIISKDFTTSYFLYNYDTAGLSSYMRNALTVESEAYDYKNLQEELEALGYSGGVEASSLMSFGLSDETRNLILTTNYNSFSISSSDGKSAVVEYGRKISGDLDIEDGYCLNYYGTELELSFNITDSSDVSYTIIPVLCNSVVTDEPLAEYSTSLIYSDEADGFYSSINAEIPGTLTFASDGTVSTQFVESVKQNITVVPNDVQSSWYATSVELTDSSVSVSATGSDTLISCTPGTEITVSAENDYNKIVFDSYTIEDSGSVSLSESSEADGICTLGHLEERMGSSLIFYSMGGSPIKTQTNIAKGDTAVQPKNPTRAGYMFGGWYTDSSCSEGSEWDFNTPITEDVRIYAKWHVDCNYTHKVTFKIEGMDDIVCIAYDGASLEAAQIPEIPEKVGYTAKWDVSDFTNITKDIVVNAVYTLTVAEYTVDYNLNGGDEGQYIPSQIKTHDVDLTLTEQKFSREGYDFKGWSTTQNGKVEYLPGGIYSANTSVTMYAVWAVHSHSWDEGIVTKDATHTEYGERTYTCLGCSETRKVPIDKTKEHSYGEWTEIDEALHMRSCECGASEYEDHNWDDGVVTVEPTHTTTGEKTCTCIGCGATTTKSVPELKEHVYKTYSGYTELVHIYICVCGEEKTSEHNWDNGRVTVEATHTEYGEIIYTCKDCPVSKTGTVDKDKNHSYGEWIFVDEELHKKICICGDVKTANHNWDDGVITTKPSHSESGEKTYKCKDCFGTKTEIIDKVEEHTYSNWISVDSEIHKKICICGNVITEKHDWGEGVVTKEPTHTEYGWKSCRCDGCESTISFRLDKLTEHSYGQWIYVDTDRHKRICECGDEDFSPHEWGNEEITLQPTHTEYGSKSYGCVGCEATKTEQIDKIAEHSYGQWIYVDTNRHKRICECGDEDFSTHEWGEEEITRQPTHTEYGECVHVCQGCSFIWKKSIAKTPEHTYSEWVKLNEYAHMKSCECGDLKFAEHDWDNGTITKQPTHTENGQRVHVCPTCSATKTEQIPKTYVHSYTEWVKVDKTYHQGLCVCGEGTELLRHRGGTATCTTKAICDVCEESYGDFAIHDYTHFDLVDSTCIETGLKEHYYCDVCERYFDMNKIEVSKSYLVIAVKNHQGGTATCASKAVCDFCGLHYGKFADIHNNKVFIPEGIATCISWGYKSHYQCSDCGQLFLEDMVTKTTTAEIFSTEYGDHYSGAFVEGDTRICDLCGMQFIITLTEVSLEHSAITMKTMDYLFLTMTKFPQNATEQLFWKSSDTSVVTVSSWGQLRAENIGTAVITVSNRTGTVSASCVVTVICSHGSKMCHFEEESTCITLGHKEYWECLDCGQLLKPDRVTETTLEEEMYTEYAPHTGGTATCSLRAFCRVCGEYYGELGDLHGLKFLRYENPSTCITLGHNSYYECSDCGQLFKSDTVTKTTLEEETHKEYAPHTGGSATCTSKATCTVCGELYGEFSNHNYKYWDSLNASCTRNGIQAHYECNVCGSYFDMNKNKVTKDSLIIDSIGHSGGKATCTSKAICAVCDVSYGELAEHIYDSNIYQYDEAEHWHKCLNCDSRKDIHCHIPGPEATAETPQICVQCGYVMAETVISYGDIDDNGLINLDDVIALLRHVSKAVIITDSNALAAGDVVEDGVLNMDDVVKLLRYVSKAIPSLK